MEGQLFGLSSENFRRLAYQLAVKNINHNFNQNKEKAGYDWLKGFIKRHPDLSLRVPEKTSATREMGFNKPVVKTFFRLLELLDTYKFEPHQVFNCDETGINLYQNANPKFWPQKVVSRLDP